MSPEIAAATSVLPLLLEPLPLEVPPLPLDAPPPELPPLPLDALPPELPPVLPLSATTMLVVADTVAERPSVASTVMACAPGVRVSELVMEDTPHFRRISEPLSKTSMEFALAPLVVALSATGELTVAPFAGELMDTDPPLARGCAKAIIGNKAAASNVYLLTGNTNLA